MPNIASHSSNPISRANAVRIFVSFAAGYFLSYALRSVNAALAPLLASDLSLSAGELGWLSSAFFLSFAAMQLPLGIWLDRHGARRTESYLLIIAAIGALVVAAGQSLLMISIGRIMIGIGVSACLMAAFSGFRAWYAPSQQGQLASAMLVFGTSGALASTWPVHLVTPYIGWRGVFLVLAGLSFLAILILYFGLPVRKQHQQTNHEVPSSQANLSWQSYQPILTNPFFWRILPLGTFCYGGFIAIQTLWFGPWLIEVMEYHPSTAAQIVFGFNTVLLFAYLFNAWILPKLAKRGVDTMRYMTWMVGASMIMQACAYFWQTRCVGAQPRRRGCDGHVGQRTC